jgi:hypothetical protein
VYGGVSPDDVLRGYLVLIVTAIGLGSFGLFCSSLVKRTTAATAITIFGVLAITIGTVFILGFWQAMASFDQNGVRRAGPFGIRSPSALAWVNPFLAQADVLCGTESNFGSGWCGFVSGIVPSDDGIIFTNSGQDVPGVAEPGVVADPADSFRAVDRAIEADVIPLDRAAPPEIAPAQQFGFQRDTLWTKSVATWLVLSVIFLFLSVQAVSPTRRWRLRRRTRTTRGASE